MKTVFKYLLNSCDTFEILLPKKAKILSFGQQQDSLYIWALVDTDEAIEYRKFRMVGTGHPIDKNLILEYIGAIHNFNGILAFHLFEVIS